MVRRFIENKTSWDAFVASCSIEDLRIAYREVRSTSTTIAKLPHQFVIRIRSEFERDGVLSALVRAASTSKDSDPSDNRGTPQKDTQAAEKSRQACQSTAKKRTSRRKPRTEIENEQPF